jgi:DNA-binding NarL/FixJ family response regulator
MNKKIKIMVVDDHTVVRKGICSLLSAEKYGIEVIGEAGNGQEAIDQAIMLQPDVILLDLLMPVMGGLEAIPLLKQWVPEAHILVLTSYAENEQVIEAIQSGAIGYVMKDASPEELVSAIQAVSLDRISIPQELALKVFIKNKNTGPSPASNPLTEREYDVLKCIASGDTNKQIATKLNLGTTTVRSHVSHILRKLNLENRTQLALYAKENKLIG